MNGSISGLLYKTILYVSDFASIYYLFDLSIQKPYSKKYRKSNKKTNKETRNKNVKKNI